MKNFYPRPPRGGRPPRYSYTSRMFAISIHALREEGDWLPARFSARRWNFYPRPPRGGRRLCLSGAKPLRPISIHALRDEGDWLFLYLYF